MLVGLRHLFEPLKQNGVNVTAVVYAPAFGFQYTTVREMAAAYCKAPCSVCIEDGVEWRETMAKENGVSGALVNYNRSCKPWSEQCLKSKEDGEKTLTFQ